MDFSKSKIKIHWETEPKEEEIIEKKWNSKWKKMSSFGKFIK